MTPRPARCNPRSTRLGAEAAALVGPNSQIETALDCRYVGQSHELTVPSVEEFHAEHARRNGYAKPDTAVEVVALRARATSVPRWRSPTSPRRRADRARAGRRERDRLHGLRPGGLARRRGSARHLDPATAIGRDGMSLDPAVAPDPDRAVHRHRGGDGCGAAARASSPNIKERVDCSAALFTATGELLVQAEHIPVHLGSMPAAVAAAIEACGAAVGPGDQIVGERSLCRRHAPQRHHARRPSVRRATS